MAAFLEIDLESLAIFLDPNKKKKMAFFGKKNPRWPPFWNFTKS